MSDLWLYPNSRGGAGNKKASRSDVLEWLGELTRREKLELLGWERCEPERPGCLDGLVPPASQVEAGAKVFKDADHLEPFASQYARAALIAAMEGVGDE